MSDVTLASLPIQDSEFPASVASGSSVGANDNGLVWNGSSWVSAKMMQAESPTTPYTVYVDQSNGSDSNKGNSPGTAFQTVGKAINALQQTGNHPGRVELIVAGGADFTPTAPISIIKAIHIEARGSGMATIDRNFDTPNGRSFWDAVTTAAGSLLQSATAAFTSSDIGRICTAYGAGVGGGTYYDFISAVPDGTHATLTATTAIARNSTTDPHGVKGQVVGDWTRVVTDAGMTSGQAVINSATAAWTTADIGTEVVIAGAGQGSQALRTAIKSVQSGTQATGTAVASATVTNKRCAIGVNFGDLFTFHVGTGGLRNVILQDTSSGRARIGAAIKHIADDGGSGSQLTPSDMRFEIPKITSSDTAGAWEHLIECDGSWNQNSGGPGCRRVFFFGTMIFGGRTVGETVRLVSPVHWGFLGGGSGGTAPTTIQQGVVILDPLNNGGGRGGPSAQDVNFAGCEGDSWCFYSEGWNTGGIFDRLQISQSAAGRRTVELAASSKSCTVVAPNHTTVGGSVTNQNADEYDAGTNNLIVGKFAKRASGAAYDQALPTSPALSYESFSRRQALTTAQTTPGTSSGILLMQSLWLPGGAQISRLGLLGHNTTPLAWGTGWTGPHFIYGIYDPDGDLFGQSADTGGTQAFNGTLSTDVVNIAKDGSGAAASSVRVPRTGLCFIALLINSGTGGSAFVYPTFTGYATPLAAIAPALCGSNGSALTALPAGPISPTGIGFMIYGGVG